MIIYAVGHGGGPVNLRLENEQGETLSLSFYTEANRTRPASRGRHYRADGGIAIWPKDSDGVNMLREGWFDAEEALKAMADFMGYDLVKREQ